jgi:thiamine-phosphate pyrophosphorylase
VLLYYITDRRQFPGNSQEQKRRLLEKVAECAAAGIPYVQLREKDLTARDLHELAREALLRIPKGTTTRLLLNARIDIALASGAHGVHLPAHDFTASEARAIFAAASNIRPLIGVSAHTSDEAAYAESHGADFAVFGPVFEKDSQSFSDGLGRLTSACKRPPVGSPMPLLALGGITLENARECLHAGAAGVAGIRLFQEATVKEVVNRLESIKKGT